MSKLAPEELQGAFALTRDLFDIAPSHIPIYRSKKGLMPWHAACTITEGKQTWIQVRSWAKEEILAHELLHAGRAHFPDGPFEEIIAFQSSRGRLRRYLSPIIQSNRESLLLLTSLIPPFFYTPLVIFPLGLIALGFFRLSRRQRQFRRCLGHLHALVHHLPTARAILYRLTTEEIVAFSKGKPQWIEVYAENQTSDRWKEIRRSYL